MQANHNLPCAWHASLRAEMGAQAIEIETTEAVPEGSWRVTARVRGGAWAGLRHLLVCRRRSPLTFDGITLETERALAAFLRRQDAPVAHPIWYLADERDGYIAAPGGAAGSHSAGSGGQAPGNAARTLAAVNKFDLQKSALRRLGLPDAPPTPQRLSTLVRRLAELGLCYPSLDWALRHLARLAPALSDLSLCCGTSASADFIGSDARLLNLSSAHWGDRHANLGALLASVDVDDQTRPAICRDYEAVAGRTLDPFSLLFWEAYGLIGRIIRHLTAAPWAPDSGTANPLAPFDVVPLEQRLLSHIDRLTIARSA